jgi:DtxR family Mn-dependent transcriptional regulator
VLGYSRDEVNEEADKLEHVISEVMEERIAHALGNPYTDPHGDPIPDRDGNMLAVETIPLTQLPDQHTATIHRITGQEPELLRYLAEKGIIPSARVQVIEKAPFNGPVTIKIDGSSAASIALGRVLTEKIFVMPITQSILEEAYE